MMKNINIVIRKSNGYNEEMHNSLSYQDYEKQSNILFVDLRTSQEYEKEHIPGAVSFPIMTDEEHIRVSTEYVQVSKETAKALGVSFVAKRLPAIVEAIQKWGKSYDKVVLYCYRGGYRSSVLFALLQALGIGVYKLNGGYKDYRKYIHDSWNTVIGDRTFITLYGNTGTGKTKILHALAACGANVIDLEGLANHRGSLLGGIGLGKQPSQKQFESNLHDALRVMDGGPIFIEGESRKVGNLYVPDILFDKLRAGRLVHIESSIPYRIQLLKDEYAHFPENEIIAALQRFRPMMGEEHTKKLVDEIKHHEEDLLIEELLVDYYDKKYNHKKKVYEATLYHENVDDAAEKLIEFSKTEPADIHQTL